MASSSSDDEPPEKKSKSQCSSQSDVGTSNFMNAIVADGSYITYRRNKVTGTKVKNTGINIGNINIKNHKHSNKSRRARPPQKKNFLEQEADDLSAKLRIAYQKIKLPNVPWLDDGDLLVGSYYVELQMVDEEKSASNEEASNERLASNEEAAEEERSASNKEADNDERSASNEEANNDERSASNEEAADEGRSASNEEANDDESCTSVEESDADESCTSVEESDADESCTSVEESDADESCTSVEESDADERSISIEEIFGDNASMSQVTDAIGGNTTAPKRILVSAPPGYGKTTLAHKIIYDWSQQQEYVRRFKLAFLIKLRNLATSITNEIADIAELFGFENKDAVSTILSNNASSTLVILDGLDELNPRERISVYKVLFRTQLSNVTIVTTCRTGSYTITREEKDILFKGTEKSNEFQDRNLTITGLTESSRERLLRKLVDSPDGDCVIRRIRQIIKADKSRNVGNLLECPLLVILLAFVIQEKSDVTIETITDLYKCFVDCMIRRSSSKNSKELPSDFTVFDNNELWAKYRNLLCDFGKLSLEVRGSDSMHFECSDKTNELYDVGFLIKHRYQNNLSVKYSYEAFHTTILEFAVAYLIWVSYENQDCEFNREFAITLVHEWYWSFSNSLIIPFLCGLLGDSVLPLLDIIVFRTVFKLQTTQSSV